MNRQLVWQSPMGWSCPRLIWGMGVSALLLYAFLRVLWPAPGGAAETLMALLGLVMVLAYGRGIRHGAATWLLAAAVAVQVLSWSLGYFHHPEWVAENPQIDRLAKLFIFIAVAWWLGGSTRNTFLMWALALVGLMLASFVQGDGVQEWLRGLQGQRVGFGVRNFQHGAMLFGILLLGLVIFAPRLLSPGRWRAWRAVGWCLALALATIAVLIGQTRAVWLALVIALPLVFLGWWLVRRARGGSMNRRVLAAGLVLLLVALGSATAMKTLLLERVGQESRVMGMLLEGKVEALPYTSIGIRIHSWRAALEWIEERPLVGWGGEGRGLVMEHTPWLPEEIRQTFGHLHNYFLEVWVAYGLLGVTVIALLALWIGSATWRSWRAGIMPGDMALFGAGFFCYWMVVNQFEAYNAFWTGVYAHNLVVGGLVTHYWRLQTSGATRQASVK
ncbi:MAG: O-antigen ligase family protein [Halomonas sp.]|uniref:O-antigen ligase family protein n=1 Tax=Halomonas sp. TaxID=1486246 RepID=UPI00286FF9E6|nr:O-antigen ligase family protein [Halomonas sp.]MDR9440497.1 O-antigen ligase family protein [Halomonas sp.]